MLGVRRGCGSTETVGSSVASLIALGTHGTGFRISRLGFLGFRLTVNRHSRYLWLRRILTGND